MEPTARSDADWALACHEAAHAIVAYVQGANVIAIRHPPAEADIRPGVEFIFPMPKSLMKQHLVREGVLERRETMGVAALPGDLEAETEAFNSARLANEVRSHLAGVVAHTRVDALTAEAACRDDRKNAKQALSQIPRPVQKTCSEYMVESQALVDRYDEEIRALAAVLLEKRELDARGFLEFVGQRPALQHGPD